MIINHIFYACVGYLCFVLVVAAIFDNIGKED